MRHLFRFLLASAAAGCAADAEPTRPDPPLTQSGPEVRYRLTILEPEAAGLSQGAGINNSGLVSGFHGVASGHRHAAVWAHGVRTEWARCRAACTACWCGPGSTTRGRWSAFPTSAWPTR